MTVPDSPEGAKFDPKNLDSRDVQEIHRNADTDSSFFALHHSLGLNQNQASPGAHVHDGKDSKVLTGYLNNTSPITVTGSRGGNAALTSLLTALATKGIITNSTSP
jgi:hypothetical protein